MVNPGAGVLGPYGWLRLIYHFPNFLKLFIRLFQDRRVRLWPKLLLVAALAYVAVPLDLLPLDWSLPVVGYIDDMVLLGLAVRLFFRSVPREVLMEHVRAVDHQDPRRVRAPSEGKD